jgi:hypothetical protein
MVLTFTGREATMAGSEIVEKPRGAERAPGLLNHAFRGSVKKLVAFAFTGLAAAFCATAALADNDQYFLHAASCSPYIVGGCEEVGSSEPLAHGLNVGGGYAFASGYHGGFALASAIFAPGAAAGLQGGRYENNAIADYTYTFQVKGLPDTLVPLHMSAGVSVSPIHLTDEQGQVVDLVDGVSDAATTFDFRIVSNAQLQVLPTRRSPYPIRDGANISVENIAAGRGSYCKNCDGAGVTFDQTIWVWSNSDISVILGASAQVIYDALGGGLDPMSTFGDVSAQVDPIFTIDDAAYSAFSIVGVPTGAAPPSTPGGVPEPASWALLLAGVGAVGGALRRRAGARLQPV